MSVPMVQAELQHDTARTMVWVESSLKLKAGSTYQRKGDARMWTVIWIGTLVQGM